ncbi:hypothetical protein L484_013286 [Morus notabilis]|uniref:Uncharacterized protein n=1 Tax=Morus notabilis TaxID=981085 RepID=W9S4A5_9ROSA|nr:hypothetical protein L484_013286 [Morus notabilis]
MRLLPVDTCPFRGIRKGKQQAGISSQSSQQFCLSNSYAHSVRELRERSQAYIAPLLFFSISKIARKHTTQLRGRGRGRGSAGDYNSLVSEPAMADDQRNPDLLRLE